MREPGLSSRLCRNHVRYCYRSVNFGDRELFSSRYFYSSPIFNRHSPYMVAHTTINSEVWTSVFCCARLLDVRSLSLIAERAAPRRVPHLLVLACAEPVHPQEPVLFGNEGDPEVVALLGFLHEKRIEWVRVTTCFFSCSWCVMCSTVHGS